MAAKSRTSGLPASHSFVASEGDARSTLVLLELSTHGGEDCQVSCSALLPFNTFSYMFFSFALLSVELMQVCSIMAYSPTGAVVICCGDIYLVKARLTCTRTHARFPRNTRERAPRFSRALTGTVSQRQSCSMSAARWRRKLRHARGLNTARVSTAACSKLPTNKKSHLYYKAG